MVFDFGNLDERPIVPERIFLPVRDGRICLTQQDAEALLAMAEQFRERAEERREGWP